MYLLSLWIEDYSNWLFEFRLLILELFLYKITEYSLSQRSERETLISQWCALDFEAIKSFFLTI